MLTALRSVFVALCGAAFINAFVTAQERRLALITCPVGQYIAFNESCAPSWAYTNAAVANANGTTMIPPATTIDPSLVRTCMVVRCAICVVIGVSLSVLFCCVAHSVLPCIGVFTEPP